MTAKWERVREIFEEGLDRPGSELESYLDQACGNDDELRASVKALFDADNDTTPFLEPKSRGAALALMGEVFARGEGMDPHQEPILIGPYQLEDTIASGGMGTVYRAIRTDGSYDHRVAIKVIKPGMATEDVLRRFKQERQTLARLNHPHIAQILDGGATNEGGPYLVMEYVNGVPIHTFCRENQQSLEDRLRIFSDVCEAVHYAHRNFVVHRDIKPGNILVNHDGQAKLLDFGIAKLMDDDDGSFTTTNASQRLMTPQYASPEQLTGGDITTASDVYSLGVVLYELLTGTRPYDLRGKKGDEARRVVCETTPSAPSTAVIRTETGRDNDPASGNPLTLGGGSLTPLSPSRLSRRLRGDLDTIVLTALHKDPDRRYASVDRLAEDIQRYRQGLPIHARRDSWAYRTNKFVRRHKVAVAAGVVMLMSLTAGAIGATWGMVRAQAGEQKARQGEMVARLEEEKARETVQFLQDMLAAAEPLNEPKDITVREILDQAALLLASDEDTKPEVRAAIHYTIGMTYRELGLVASAEDHLRRALVLREESYGSLHRETVHAMTALAALLIERGEEEEAEALLLHVEESISELGLQGDAVLVGLHDTLSTLASERLSWEDADDHASTALQHAEVMLGEDHPRTLDLLNNLAAIRARQGKYDDAGVLYEDVLDRADKRFGEKSPRSLAYANNHATLLTRQRKLEEAGEAYRSIYESSREVSGHAHPRTLAALSNLLNIMVNVGQFAEAKPLAIDLLSMRRESLGNDEPKTLQAMVTLSSIHRGLGEIEAAEALLLEAVDRSMEHLGQDDPRTWRYQQDLARFYTRIQNWSAAQPILQALLRVQTRSLGASHADTTRTASILALTHVRTSSFAEALSILEPLVNTLTEVNGAGARGTLVQRANLAKALMGLDRYDDALVELDAVIALGEETLSGNWLLPLFQSYRGECLHGLDRSTDAEAALLEAYQTMAEIRGEADSRTRQVAASIVKLYDTEGDEDSAAAWRPKSMP